MTRLELAGFVSSAFQIAGIDVVLSGVLAFQSTVRAVCFDGLDFVNAMFAKRDRIKIRHGGLGLP